MHYGLLRDCPWGECSTVNCRSLAIFKQNDQFFSEQIGDMSWDLETYFGDFPKEWTMGKIECNVIASFI